MDDFYAARTANMAALPWSNFAPPFSAQLAKYVNQRHVDLNEDWKALTGLSTLSCLKPRTAKQKALMANLLVGHHFFWR
ncbi:hypothetical protein [Pseudophaeobacter sp. TrK17]|uniref:hypothetical protein n=1 Tax=Pseudophaeobacter sp. TrK17 TaxID=2815167 RepID=UPI0035CFCC55